MMSSVSKNSDQTAPQGDILIVDDNPNNLAVLSGILEEAGHKVRPAINGMLALKAAQITVPDLVLLDIRMPQMNGYQVAEQLQGSPETAEVPIIFISALQDTEDKVAAFKSGGVDYIVKPFQVEEVLARVRTHLALSATRQSLQRAYTEMEQRVERRTRELLEVRDEQLKALEQTITAMGMAMEKRDPYTAGHQHRVSHLATAIAEQMGLDKECIDAIRLGGLIHDIGKISVPSEVLNRPGHLSTFEMNLIYTHSQSGYEITKGIDFPWPIAEIVHQHHERYDGSGYPQGLRGEEITLEARVIAVADVLEAMSSHRPYRPALGIDAGLEELHQHRGSRYDPQVVDAVDALFARPGGYQFPEP